MEKLDLIKGIMDAKKSENNTIDLGAYFEGLCDMYDKLMADKEVDSDLETIGLFEPDLNSAYDLDAVNKERYLWKFTNSRKFQY